MSPNTRYDDGFCRMFVGDAIDVLSSEAIPEKSVHCCVTSPPYFGLRSYLPSDHPDKTREGGTQEAPEQYVAWLVDVFRGVWRVLRDDGTVWLNLGDSYASGGMSNPSSVDALDGGKDRGADGYSITRKPPPGLKPKDLLMIPARVALALQADGWYLRSQIVWTKPNPMPESVTDRPTQATEMVYLLTKKPRYFYDSEAVKEPAARPGKTGTFGGEKGRNLVIAPTDPNYRNGHQQGGREHTNGSGRNLRNYWQISTRPYSGSHYAVFPQELPLRCIKAGTSEHGVCSECGAPWRRVVERAEGANERNEVVPDYDVPGLVKGTSHDRVRRLSGSNYVYATRATNRFEPTCPCGRALPEDEFPEEIDAWEYPDGTPEPATVLDPFSGSGTTGLAARKLGRRSVLIDIDDRNVKLLEQRMGYQGVLL